MTVTVTKIKDQADFQPQFSDGVTASIHKIALDSSYPTGGEALTKVTDLGFASGDTIKSVEAVATEGYSAEYDDTNELLKMFVSGGTEVTNGTDLSAEHVVLKISRTLA